MGTPPKSRNQKQKSAKPKAPPFRFICPPEVGQPKKPKWLPDAIKPLGPFRFQTDAEALAAGAEYVDGKTRFPISAEAAPRLVTGIALRFNTDAYFDARAPRIKDIYSELSELSDAINKLSSRLGILNDVTLHELRAREDMALFYGEEVIPNMNLALTNELPRPENETCAPETQTWQDRLAALSRHTEFTKRRLRWERERQGRSASDKGGATNMLKTALGPPKWGLVIDCLTIFDAFKPGEATGHGEGPFHDFVAEVFEFATGKESSTAGVAEWVKRLVPPYHQLKRVQAEISDIFASMAKLEEGTEISTATGQKRWVELKKRLDVLQPRQLALSERCWPHVRLSKL